jgi:hypothetical protein
MSFEENRSRFTLNQKLSIITVILVVAVVSSPFVYAIVEPHIKITMDVGQTTKPIQIVDNQEVEVFSVDVDGTIFPVQGGGGSEIDFGTEIVVLDQSAKDGESQQNSNGSFDPFGYAFDLPTSANLWKITAIEFKTGDAVFGTEGFCVGAWQDGGFLVGQPTMTLPLVDNEFYAVSLVAWAEGDDFFAWTTDTVYKFPTTSLILQGGTTVVTLAGNCGTGGSEFAGSSTTTESWGEAQGSNLSNLDNALAHFETLKTEHNNFEYYMKVYAVPIS